MLKVKIFVGAFVFFIEFLSSSISLAQDNSTSQVWKKLADVTFQSKTVRGQKLEYPVFGAQVKSLEGQVIRLKGYVLPIDLENDRKFIFSLLPYNSCFFCGAAGPETVLEVYSKNKIVFSDKAIHISGKLVLNAEDTNHLMYLLKEAVLSE